MIILRNTNNQDLEQKEFGFINSKIVRPFKSKIGKTRRDLGTKLERGIKLNDIKYSKLNLSNEGSGSLDIDKVLDKKASKLKTRVIVDTNLRNDATTIVNTKGVSGRTVKSNIEKNPNKTRTDKILLDAINDKNIRSVISLSPQTLSSGYAHELGHVENRYNGSIKDKIISRLDGPKTRKRVESPIELKNKSSNKSILQDIRDKMVVTKEESNASKKALKSLKEAGMNEEDLREARKILDDSYKTYELKEDSRVKAALRSRIQIPSRLRNNLNSKEFGNRRKLIKNENRKKR